METIKVNMTPCDEVQTIHTSQNDTEARQWEFELHNNGELIDTSGITEQMVFKSYEGGTEQILPENGAVPVTAPFVGDIKYPDATRNDQEFLYRQSPTEEDGNAKIKSLYGNTLVWNQLVENGDFSDGTNRWSASNPPDTLSVSDNILSFHTNVVYGAVLTTLPIDVNNHVLLVKAQVRTQGNSGIVRAKMTNNFGYTNSDFAFPIEQVNVWTDVLMYGTYTTTPQGSTESPKIGFQDYRNISSSNLIEVKNVQVFDLTLMGLDISSPSDFTSLFPKPYYDYCQGAMLSFGGRNVKFNQLVQNGNFVDTNSWDKYNCTLSVSNNVATITATATSGNIYTPTSLRFAPSNGDKVLVCGKFRAGTGTARLRFNVGGTINVTENATTAWQTVANVVTAGSSGIGYAEMFAFNSSTAEYKDVMVFNLTQMFGAGNEPSAEGFRELFPNDYYEYTTGKYMNIGQPVGIKTMRKNLFSGAESYTRTSAGYYIREGTGNNPLPLKLAKGTYTISIKSTVAGTSQLELFSGGIASSDRFLAPYISLVVGVKTYTFTIDKQSDYIRLYGNFIGTLSDIQIEFGSTATGYEPYAESTLPIPLDEFPNGMDGINDARDEKNETGYKKKIGRVDLGTLTYTYTQTSLRFEAQMPPNYKIPTSVSDRGNMICAKYSTNPNPLLGNGQEGITGYQNSNKVFISDQSTTDPAVFKTMMNGVVLYYELKTPLENYGVVDLGSLTWTKVGAISMFYASYETTGQFYSGTVLPNITNNKYAVCSANTMYGNRNGIVTDDVITVNAPFLSSTEQRIVIADTSFTDATALKNALSGSYLLFEKQNPQGFTTATLVTENGEVALANENGVLVGKCNSDVSADAGFIEGKIKLSDEDGDVYSSKIQIHVERSPQ